MEAIQSCLIVCLSEDSLSKAYNFVKQLKDSSNWVSHGSSHYVALVTDHCKDSVPCNIWLKCAEAPPITPPTPSLRRQISRCMTLTELDNCLWACRSDTITKGREDLVSNEIHWLLDHHPWNNDEYMLMTVIVIVSGSMLTNASVDIYGALLRLRTWNNASIYFITTEQHIIVDEPEESFTWQDLSVCIPAQITSYSNVIQTLSSNILWKGPVRIPEHKSYNSPTPLALILPGFILSHDDNYPSGLFYEVGLNINHTHYPSHLELVKVINVNDIPLVWLSPLTVKLSIDPTFESTPSGHLFKDIFQSSSPSKGILLRLNMKCSIESRNQLTKQWRLHILEKETTCGNINPMSSALSSLCDYYPGPLLLVLPTTAKTKSCDARLLWKPQAMLNVGATVKQHLLIENSWKPEISDQGPLSRHVTNENVRIYEKCVPPSELPEVVALRTLEAIGRKQIKRKDSSELTLGGVAAPPPSGMSTSLSTTTDLLECFMEDGRAKSELSPVPMNEVSEDVVHPLHMIDPSGPSIISYKQVLDSTPTTARRYHGVSYCFNEDDTSRDSKLMKIQKQFIASERSSNCSDYCTPMKNTELKNRKKSTKTNNNRSSTEEASESVIDLSRPHTDQSQSHTNQSQSGTKYKRSRTNARYPTYHSSINTRSSTRNKTSLNDLSAGNVNLVPLTEETSHKRKRKIKSRKGPIESPSMFIAVKQEIKTESCSPLETTTEMDYDERNVLKNGIPQIELRLEKSFEKLRTSKARRSLCISGEELPAGLFGGTGQPLSHDTTCNKDTVIVLDDRVDNINTNRLHSSEKRTEQCDLLLKEQSSTAMTSISIATTSISTMASVSLTKCTTGNINNNVKLTIDNKSVYSMKKILEKEIVSSLKSNAIKNGHRCFRSCYVRLFRICKVYVKDLKPMSVDSIKKQIRKIVDCNVKQVIDFETTNN